MIILLVIYIYICAIGCLLFQYCVSYSLNEKVAHLLFFSSYAITIETFNEYLESDAAETNDVIYYLLILILGLTSLFPDYSIVHVIKSMINIGIGHNAISISIFKLLAPKYQIITYFLGSFMTIELQEGDEDILYEYKRVMNDADKNKLPIKIVKLAKEYDEIEFDSKQEIVDAMNRKNRKYGEFHMSDMGSRRIVITPFQNSSLGID
ncbi:hypothetical protein BCR36DRAFT_400169 [Piromyces finnis]|uniref:Uncharacterized protein n=1 Tax=Piromyces finnis TaxID=1754191 RepID=A0A1Y1UXH6_9FUNG|nr:hypothetical protein BCR36DRAFT_400169 [Piromyces finnis]|eukprot:ORX42906.1 hypothetical protein BCR36DRAFT_400169 [Piromyces finnis]